MSKLPLFKLEDYLSTREFSAPFMLCASDVESHLMQEVLAMADAKCQKLWEDLPLSYTETYGMPLLLSEISKLYIDKVSDKNILTFTGAEEGVYCAFHVLLEPKDHAIVVTPCYQSLLSIPSSLCDVSKVELRHDEGWDLDINKIKDSIKPNTKLLVINYPHNPTGAVLTKQKMQQIIDLARQHGVWVFSDEVYRLLDFDVKDSLPPLASMYERGLSLGVMSKSFGLAGLRIGWVAAQDKAILKEMNRIKHYLSICNSAPSEILALIALKNQCLILKRNLALVKNNLKLLDNFFVDYRHIFEWVRPKAGCIGFPKLKSKQSIDDFSKKLLKAKGVVILPSSVYDFDGKHFRIGFGRKNFNQVLLLMKKFIDTKGH